jgi:hypothetical protein
MKMARNQLLVNSAIFWHTTFCATIFSIFSLCSLSALPDDIPRMMESATSTSRGDSVIYRINNDLRHDVVMLQALADGGDPLQYRVQLFQNQNAVNDPFPVSTPKEHLKDRPSLIRFFLDRGYQHRSETVRIREVFFGDAEVFSRAGGEVFIYSTEVPLGGLIQFTSRNRVTIELLRVNRMGNGLNNNQIAMQGRSAPHNHQQQTNRLSIHASELESSAPNLSNDRRSSSTEFPVSREIADLLHELQRRAPRPPLEPRRPHYIDVIQKMQELTMARQRLTETSEEYRLRIIALAAEIDRANEQNRRMRELYNEQFQAYLRAHAAYQRAHSEYVQEYNTLLIEGYANHLCLSQRVLTREITFADLEGGNIIAADGTYLGKISRNTMDADSITNRFGNYGSPYSSRSILSQYGTYGSEWSSHSPFNRYTRKPPKIVFGNEEFVYLTVNTSIESRVDPNLLLEWLGITR